MTFLRGFLGGCLLAPSLIAFSPQGEPCLSSSVILNTGANHVAGGIFPIGAAEPFWTVVGDPDGGTTEPRPSTVILKHPAWQPALAGSQWISSYPSASDDLNGFYEFQTKFCLRQGWSNVNLQIRLRADDRATVFLNNQPIGSTPASFSFSSTLPTSIQVTNAALFVTGENLLRVQVENIGSVAMGFNLAGQVTASGLSLLDPECCQRNGSISGRKFEDTNGNGVMDPTEQAIAGWGIDLALGTNNWTTTTDSNGYFYFQDLTPGSYVVSEQQSSGWVQTAPASGNFNVTLGQVEAVDGLLFGNKPGCMQILKESVECIGAGLYNYTFTVQNLSPEIVQFLVFHDVSAGVTLTGGDVVTLPNPLPPGQSATVSVTISAPNGAPEFCFMLAAHTNEFEECCMIEHCVKLPNCCGLIKDECLRCDPTSTNGYQYQFTYVNLSTDPVAFIYLTSTNNCFNSVTLTLTPPLAPGQSTNLTAAIQVKPDCGPELCFLVSAQTKDRKECCVFIQCVRLPQCCGERTYTLDADFDEGVMLNVNHNVVANQLQFNTNITPFPYVNIAASARGTMVRIEVNTGQILGEYLSSPDNMSRDPSRTTVDQFGNVWLGNRAETSGGRGSVTKYALIIGGTRGDKIGTNFVANPAGQYLAPPFIYSTAVDRDADGLIKTSTGLGNILPWNNAGAVDSNGGVTTAEDEMITHYVRTAGTGARALAIDANNDLWVGGLNDRDHEKYDGTTGAPVFGTLFNSGWGGYGGLIGVDGALWSAAPLMRFVPNPTAPPAGLATNNLGVVTGGSYGLGIDPCNGHVWVSDGMTNGQLTLFEFDAAGNALNTYPQPFWAQGLAVDGNGHVWVAQGFGSQVWHLAPNPIIGQPHIVVGIVTGLQGVTGLAVDSNGKIWAAELIGNRASAIDPNLGVIGGGGFNVGAIDTNLVVNLGPGASPYNYSDMTGMVAIGATQPLGLWTVVHDGGFPGINWGTVSWTSSEPPGTGISVEVRSADTVVALASQPWLSVSNKVAFCDEGVFGRYLEVRVKFLKPPGCDREGPVLFDLTVACCKSGCDEEGSNNPPKIFCPEAVEVCDPKGASLTLTGQVADPEGDALMVTWFVNAVLVQTDSIPSGTPNTLVNVTLNHTFPAGSHTVVMVVQDAAGNRTECKTTVTIGDKTPPRLQCPPGVSVVGFQGQIPNFIPRIEALDNCPGELKIEQSPAAGTGVGPGVHPVMITVTDAAGNSVTCQTFYAVQPVVQITQPKKYDYFDPGASVTIRGEPTAGADRTTIRSVEFYLNDGLLGVDAEPPYEFTVPSIPAGDHRLSLAAVNEQGVKSISETLMILARAKRATPPPTIVRPHAANGEFTMEFQAPKGQTVHLETSDDLAPGKWQISRTFPGDDNVHSITNLLQGTARKYYRLRFDPGQTSLR